MLVVKGQTVYVPLRATGKIAFLSVARPHTVTYMDLAPASANAVHGMALRPDVVPPSVSLTLPRQKFAQATATGVRVRSPATNRATSRWASLRAPVGPSSAAESPPRSPRAARS